MVDSAAEELLRKVGAGIPLGQEERNVWGRRFMPQLVTELDSAIQRAESLCFTTSRVFERELPICATVALFPELFDLLVEEKKLVFSRLLELALKLAELDFNSHTPGSWVGVYYTFLTVEKLVHFESAALQNTRRQSLNRNLDVDSNTIAGIGAYVLKKAKSFLAEDSILRDDARACALAFKPLECWLDVSHLWFGCVVAADGKFGPMVQCYVEKKIPDLVADVVGNWESKTDPKVAKGCLFCFDQFLSAASMDVQLSQDGEPSLPVLESTQCVQVVGRMFVAVLGDSEYIKILRADCTFLSRLFLYGGFQAMQNGSNVRKVWHKLEGLDTVEGRSTGLSDFDFISNDREIVESAQRNLTWLSVWDDLQSRIAYRLEKREPIFSKDGNTEVVKMAAVAKMIFSHMVECFEHHDKTLVAKKTLSYFVKHLQGMKILEQQVAMEVGIR